MDGNKKRQKRVVSSHYGEQSRRIQRARERAKKYVRAGESLVDELLAERRLEAKLE